jgi:hypothetical protein
LGTTWASYIGLQRDKLIGETEEHRIAANQERISALPCKRCEGALEFARIAYTQDQRAYAQISGGGLHFARFRLGKHRGGQVGEQCHGQRAGHHFVHEPKALCSHFDIKI